MGLPAVVFDTPTSSPVELKPAPPSTPTSQPSDFRLRALMSEADWASLPSVVRRRFSRQLAAGQSIVYSGEILESRMSRAGWWLAQAARLIGGPLPLTRSAHGACTHVPTVVTVTGGMGGQIWTRLYARRNGFPQVIHSSKRFAGPTGLEEHVGAGVGMTLTVYAREARLIFRSGDYFVDILRWRMPLPKWICPGTIYVTHAELPDGKFSFTLQVIHPRLGLLLRQMAIFREVVP